MAFFPSALSDHRTDREFQRVVSTSVIGVTVHFYVLCVWAVGLSVPLPDRISADRVT